MFSNPLRQKLKNSTTYGIWVTLESPAITEIAATLNLDWVCIEMEHGHLGYSEVMAHVRAVAGSDTAILVRVPAIDQSAIKRVLDMGVHGVIIPLVRTSADVENGMRFARYPLVGERGIGGERAVKWGLEFKEYLNCANEEVLVIPLIETKEALENIDAILDISGVEAIWFGPADLSASFGYLGDWEGPGVADKILQIKDKAAGRGIASGILCQSVDDGILRQDQGFKLVTVGSDTSLLIRSIVESLKSLKK